MTQSCTLEHTNALHYYYNILHHSHILGFILKRASPMGILSKTKNPLMLRQQNYGRILMRPSFYFLQDLPLAYSLNLFEGE